MASGGQVVAAQAAVQVLAAAALRGRAAWSPAAALAAAAAGLLLAVALDVAFALRAVGGVGGSDEGGGIPPAAAGSGTGSGAALALAAAEELARGVLLVVVEDMAMSWASRLAIPGIPGPQFDDALLLDGASALVAFEVGQDANARADAGPEPARSAAKPGRGSRSKISEARTKAQASRRARARLLAKVRSRIVAAAGAALAVVVCIPAPATALAWQTLRVLEAADVVLWEHAQARAACESDLGHAGWRPGHWLPVLAAKGHRDVNLAFFLPAALTALARFTIAGVGLPLAILQILSLVAALRNVVDHGRPPRTGVIIMALALLALVTLFGRPGVASRGGRVS